MRRLTVEYQSTSSRNTVPPHTFLPQRQESLYRYATGKQATDTKPHFVPSAHIESPLWETAPSEDTDSRNGRAYQQSISEIELAARGHDADTKISEYEAKATMNGVTGHTLVTIAHTMARAIFEKQPLVDAVDTLPFPPETNVLLHQTFGEAANKYNVIGAKNIVPFVRDTWTLLRKEHKMTDANRRGSIIHQGSQYGRDWVFDYWNSPQMANFENAVLSTVDQEIQNYINPEITPFDSGEGLFLPLEVTPALKLIGTELSFQKRVSVERREFQFRGRADAVLQNQSHVVIIDHKFSRSYDSLLSNVGQVQALLYTAHTVGAHPYAHLHPKKTLLYYHWYDLTARKSYLIDGTPRGAALEQARLNLKEYATTWADHYKEFWAIKRERERAIVIPFLSS